MAATHDDFVRSDASDLNTGGTLTYADIYHDTSVAGWALSSNKAVIASAAIGTYDITTGVTFDMGSADHYVSIRLGSLAPSGTSSVGAGPVVRWDDVGSGGGSGYYVNFDVASGPVWTIYLNKVTAGAYSGTVGSQSLTALGITPGPGHVIGCKATGTTLALYWNNQLVKSFTDSTFSSGTRGGFTGKQFGIASISVDYLWLNEDPYATTFTPKVTFL
jgi:hypothetical protein